MMYPDAAKFDSINVNFVADSIKVEESGKEAKFFVCLGNGVDITVEKGNDGQMKVISSHGLLKFDDGTMEFAKKTGQWKDGITDNELSMRMNDKDFEKSLIENFEKDFPKSISIVHNVPNSNPDASEIQSIYVVKNNLPIQIDGSDYEVSIPFFEESFMFDPNPKRWKETRKGKTISPNGSVTYGEYIVTERGSFSRSGPVFDGHTIVLKLKGKDLFNKYFLATGNEYEDYLKTKGK